MYVTAAKEVTEVATISRTQPLVEEAMVELMGNNQRKLYLTKS